LNGKEAEMPIPFADPLIRSSPNPNLGAGQMNAQAQLAQLNQANPNQGGRPISMGQPWLMGQGGNGQPYGGRPNYGFPFGSPYGPRYGVRSMSPWGNSGQMLGQQPQSQYPFQLGQQLGLGDYFQPHAAGDAQNMGNSTVGANFLGPYAPRR
jgi:hypothetical protein